MGKLLYGSQITDIVGSIGGLTFQHSSAGQICRAKPFNSTSMSQAQIERTVYFAQAVAAFKSLSTTQKSLWKSFAAAHPKVNYYGETKILTAQNWFTSLFLNARTVDQSPLLVPPTYVVPTLPSIPTSSYFDCSIPEFFVEFDAPFDFSPYFLLIYASPLSFNNSLLDRSNIYFIHTLAPATEQSFDIYPYYVDAYFAGDSMQIDSGLPVFIKVGLVLMSKSSFLCSQMGLFTAYNAT
jgi:hypothetical protein